MPKLQAVALAVAILLYGVPASAQYTTASLGGTVTDASGAVIPGAKVTARNTDTGMTKSVSTGVDGAYLFPALPVGHYNLTVEKPGFTRYVQRGITLTDSAFGQIISAQDPRILQFALKLLF